MNTLPENLKREVLAFIDFLQTKKNSSKKPGTFGSVKGKIRMAYDFDYPVVDFKEYILWIILSCLILVI
ncbi:DUF2281 domain-containing protein [Cesiribacter sp. SM1]|uniref:type II toxin-antitoxin system VapB family antitoxin n=1 Tax=Cesiribacter sp. SM1 TaxID=2861196 RepID=UPI001CD776BD